MNWNDMLFESETFRSHLCEISSSCDECPAHFGDGFAGSTCMITVMRNRLVRKCK